MNYGAGRQGQVLTAERDGMGRFRRRDGTAGAGLVDITGRQGQSL